MYCRVDRCAFEQRVCYHYQYTQPVCHLDSSNADFLNAADINLSVFSFKSLAYEKPWHRRPSSCWNRGISRNSRWIFMLIRSRLERFRLIQASHDVSTLQSIRTLALGNGPFLHVSVGRAPDLCWAVHCHLIELSGSDRHESPGQKGCRKRRRENTSWNVPLLNTMGVAS